MSARGHSRQKSQQEALITEDLGIDFDHDAHSSSGAASISDILVVRDYGAASPSHPMGELPPPPPPLPTSATTTERIPGAPPPMPTRPGTTTSTTATTTASGDQRRRSFADSEVLMAKADEIMQRRWWKHPRIRENYRLVLGSALLTLIGIALLVFGVIVLTRPASNFSGWVFLLIGFLCFIPGIYHVVYITCTLCGRPGYSFDNLPTFA